MNRKRIKIGKPEVIVEGGRCVLRAVINDDGVKKTLDYKVDAKYGEYLTWERSDAFVLALMYYAMVFKKDIEWETPCDERLIFQLSNFFIPAYDREIDFMHSIDLIGPTTAERLPSANGVATGFSNGIDSSYTIYKFMDYADPKYKLTHLIFTDCMFTYHTKEYQEDFVNEYLGILPNCAEELGLEFVFVEFHVDKLFSVGFIRSKNNMFNDPELYTLKYCSIAFALEKLLHVYYFSSGHSLSDFDIGHKNTQYHDIFTLPLISTDALLFVSSGMELRRVDKLGTLIDWPYAQRHLHVCNEQHDSNCGHCQKCIQEMTNIYAYGKLDLYKDVFPIDDFKAHLSKRIGLIMGWANNGIGLDKETLAKVRENKAHIPFGAYICSLYYTVYEFLRRRLRGTKWARRIYKKLHLRKVLHPEWKYDLSRIQRHSRTGSRSAIMY